MKNKKQNKLIIPVVLSLIFLAVLVSAGVFSISLNAPINYANISGTDVLFNCTGTSTANVVNMSLWHNFTGTWHRNETNYLDLIQSHGVEMDTYNTGTAYTGYDGVRVLINDTNIFLNSISRNASANITKAYLLNSTKGVLATAEAFVGDTAEFGVPYEMVAGTIYYIVGDKDGVARLGLRGGYDFATNGAIQSRYLNWTGGLIDGGDNPSNIWEIVNISVTVGSASERTFIKNLTDSGIWNCEFCDDDGVCDYATSNYTIYIPFFENSVTYNTPVYSTSTETFLLNLTIIGSYSSISAKLIYNNTEYTSSLTSGVNDIFTNTINIPSVTTQTNKSFYWSLNLGGTKINTTTYSQTVSPISFSFCDATHTTPFINISTREAENPFPTINASIKTAWSISASNDGSTSSYSYEDLSETNNSWAFCSALNNSLYVSAQIEVDGTLYSKNFHYLNNATLTNLTNNITLYLINDSEAVLTELQVQDASQNPLSDVYISIQLYDVGTDTFYTVGMAKTSTEGKDLTYLNWYDSLYKFVLVRDGTVIKSTSPYKISETPQIFKILSETIFIFDKFENFEYNLFFNDTTNNFVLTFVKPSGDVIAGCLRVIKRNQTNDYTICNICETSSSATVYCNVNGYGNGTYLATFYSLGSLKVISTISEVIGVVNEIYNLIGNLDGTVLAIIISGVIMVFFLISPSLGVVGLILGMVATFALGFQPIDYMTFIGIALLGGLVIWFLKK